MGKKRCCDDEDLLPLLTEDNLIPILAQLPVVSLLRFKSVCKSWLALIESSFFIDLHTTTTTFNSSSSSEFGSFIFQVSKPSNKRIGVNEFSSESAVIMLSSGSESGSGCWITSTDADDYDYDYDQVFKVDNNIHNLGGGCSNDDQQLVFKLDNLGFPSCYKSSVSSRVIGSCNGIICLFDDQMFGRQTMDFSLWNPATRQFRILPKSITIENGATLRSAAFGLDVETRDYKVVLVIGFQPRMWFGLGPMECLCRVQVYSLSTDSWKLLEGITSLPGFPFFDTFEALYLNGTCLLMAKLLHSEKQTWFPENDRFIISFDFTKEIITTIQIPDHDKNQKLYLSCLGDKMALFAERFPCIRSNVDYDIWVLNEHNSGSRVNKESWTKLHSFQIISRVSGDCNIPKGISNDGEFALLETISIGDEFSKKMKLYNLVTKEVKKDFLCCYRVVSRVANVYKPSLVSIIGGDGAAAGAVRVIGGAM